jgi:MFS family permease
MTGTSETIPAEVKTQPFTSRHFRVLITCVLCIFGPGAIIFSCSGLCYKAVANELGLEVSNVSFYMTILYIFQVLGSVPMGYILKKFDVRIVCTIAACCMGVPVLLMSMYTEIWQWYISGAFMGVGMVTIFWLMTAGLLNKWFFKKLGFVIGLSYAMTGVGGAVFNIIGQFILGGELLGWRNLYMFYGIAILCLSVPFTLTFIRSTPEEVGLRPYGRPLEDEVDDAGEVLKPEIPGVAASIAYKKWWFYLLILAGAGANIVAIYPQHFTTFYQSFVAMDRDTGEIITELMILSGTLEAFVMIGQALGKVILGALETKSILLALILGCSLGSIGAMLMLWGGTTRTLPIMWGGGFIYGILYAYVSTLLPYVTRLVFGSKDYERIYSVILIPVNLIGAFAASGLALIYQNAGWGAFWGTDVVIAVIIFISMLIVVRAGIKFYREPGLGGIK